jgi:hypothetical protein
MDTLLQYYKLKQKYNDNLKKRKLNIKKNTEISFKERSRELKKLVGKCINCGKAGGTIFEEKNGMLKAVCAASTPCNLNINIKRKYYDNAQDLEHKYMAKSENLKMNIIITKLDYLFGINNSKDEIVEKFNKLKDELAHISELQLINLRKYGDIISGIPSDPLLNDAQMDLANEIAELKNTYDEYLADPAHADAYLSTMIEQYINTIKPLTEKIRDMNYNYYMLEMSEDANKRSNEEGEGEGDGGDGGDGDGKKPKGVKKIPTYTLIAKAYRLDQKEQERQ